MPDKRALITGVTGQDGAYLSELLLNNGYEVIGMTRRASPADKQRFSESASQSHPNSSRYVVACGDLTDSSNLIRIIEEYQPGEIYNLAAQSQVRMSFEMPEYTANCDALGVLRLLEAVRILKRQDSVRFYQASTSELFGMVQETPQKETTPFYPKSPYGVAKLYGYWITRNYREAYGMFACNGILFNHISPLRGESYVTRKITRSVARIKLGMQERLVLGNLDAKRDWGFAGDYAEAMWLMLQHDEPDDFVIATGQNHSVREFAERAFAEVEITIDWRGKGIDERGFDAATGLELVKVDKNLFRPSEVDVVLGDPTKAREVLHWQPKVTFDELVRLMVEADLKEAEAELFHEQRAVPESQESCSAAHPFLDASA